MLKLLIVEDEKIEREGLINLFDWDKLGISIIGTACDGIEGLEMAETVRPDIIITDIRMPGMNGLKMCKQIKEFLPNVKIIILTGHDEFDYALEAIKFGANAYILKPFDEAELLEALESMKSNLNYI